MTVIKETEYILTSGRLRERAATRINNYEKGSLHKFELSMNQLSGTMSKAYIKLIL